MFGSVVSEVQQAGAQCTINHNAQGSGSWFTTWKTKLWQASGAIVFFSDKYRGRFTEALRWEAGAILRIRRDRPDFKLFIFDPAQHKPAEVRANILDGESVMGDVSKWERFVTTTLDFKHKWVNGKNTGPDPDYTPCSADPDAETSAPPAGGETTNPFSKSNYKPTTTRADLRERRSIARKLSSVSARPAAAESAPGGGKSNLDRLVALEQVTFGEARSGGLGSRLKAVEEDWWGSAKSGPLQERLAALEADLLS